MKRSKKKKKSDSHQVSCGHAVFILSNGALVSSRDQLLTGASFLQVWFSDPPGDFESYLVFFLFFIKKINFKISIYRKVAKMVSPRVLRIQVPLLLPFTTVHLSPPMNQCWYIVNLSLPWTETLSQTALVFDDLDDSGVYWSGVL